MRTVPAPGAAPEEAAPSTKQLPVFARSARRALPALARITLAACFAAACGESPGAVQAGDDAPDGMAGLDAARDTSGAAPVDARPSADTVDTPDVAPPDADAVDAGAIGDPCCFGDSCDGVCGTARHDAGGDCAEPPRFGAEVCDGVDNDCDGSVDEGDPSLGTACSTGEPGVCAAGTRVCTAGAIACERTATPGTEVCNGVDDDCDGSVDEYHVPFPGGCCLPCWNGGGGVYQEFQTEFACVGGSLACRPVPGATCNVGAECF